MSQEQIGLITHCDINYLSRALSLIDSLRVQEDNSPVHVLCHDSSSFQRITELNLSKVYPMNRSDMYEKFPDLINAEKNRTSLEFYYCFSPFLLKYLQLLKYEKLVYLDSDLYFFDTITSTLSLSTGYDVGIVPHRFEKNDSNLNQYGVYNVGLVYFENNENAINTLDWWAESCLNSTKLEVTETSFGDQKYLDFFKDKQASIFEYRGHGDNAAPWNCNFAELINRDQIRIKGEALHYYHFSGLRIYRRFATLGFTSYRKKPNSIMKTRVYRRYIKQVIFWESQIGDPNRVDYRKITLREVFNAIRYRDLVFI